MEIILETERLYLRAFTPEDSTHFYRLNSDASVLQYTGDHPFQSEKKASDFIKNYIHNSYNNQTTNLTSPLGRYAVIRKRDAAFLGWCGFKYHKDKRVIDLGYRFYKQYWGNGYATESAEGCINFAFAKAKYPFLIAHAHVNNTSSHKVLDRCGMRRQKQITYDSQPTYRYRLDNPNYHLREIKAEETWPVRHPVLRKGRPLKEVYMEADEMESTFHLGMFYKEKVVGVASFMHNSHEEFTGVQHRLRGMAVLSAYRKRGIAALLLKKGETMLREKGVSLLWFNARTVALSFYKNQGYEVVGDPFEIPLIGTHYRMKKEL